MGQNRDIKAKVTFRPSQEVRQIIEDELKAHPDLNLTDLCNHHLLMASQPDFRRAYRAALQTAAKRIAEELRKLDDMDA